jgi:hypothetical protein
MSNGELAIVFRALAEEVLDTGHLWGRDQLAIWGGQCSEADVLALLRDWPQRDEDMPFCIWEYADRIVIERETLPEGTGWLERGRLFGPGGDLTVRRDGEHFLWHFVGRWGARPPSGSYGAQDFWTQPNEAGTTFHQREKCALLWGERQEGFDLWFENRTARAELRYPLEQTGWVRVRYQTFSRAGQTEFVWLMGLEAHDE